MNSVGPSSGGPVDPIAERLRSRVPESPEEVVERLRRQLSRERVARLDAESRAEGRLLELWKGRERAELLSRITDEANKAYRMQDAFKASMRLLGEHAHFVIGHAFVVVSGTRPLESSGIWWEKQPGLAAKLRDATAMITFDRGVGLPGTAWMKRETVWLSREEFSSGNFPRNFVIPDLGINTAVAFPVFAGDEVVAIVEFFGRELMNRDEELISIFNEFGKQLGRIVERVQAESTMERRVLARTADLVRTHDELVKSARSSHGVVAKVLGEMLDRRSQLGEGEIDEVLVDLAAAADAHGRDYVNSAHTTQEVIAALPPSVRVLHLEDGLPAVGLEPDLFAAVMSRLERDDARDIQDDSLLDESPRPSQTSVSLSRRRRDVEILIERSTPWHPQRRLIDLLRIDHLRGVASRAGGELVVESANSLIVRVPGKFSELRLGEQAELPQLRRTLILLSVEREVMRLMARSVLEGLGCTVETDYWYQDPNKKPHAVLADLSRAPTYLKRSAPGTVIIGLSAGVTEEMRRQGVEMGLADVLSMPLARDEVAAALSYVLDAPTG